MLDWFFMWVAKIAQEEEVRAVEAERKRAEKDKS